MGQAGEETSSQLLKGGCGEVGSALDPCDTEYGLKSHQGKCRLDIRD